MRLIFIFFYLSNVEKLPQLSSSILDLFFKHQIKRKMTVKIGQTKPLGVTKLSCKPKQTN